MSKITRMGLGIMVVLFVVNIAVFAGSNDRAVSSHPVQAKLMLYATALPDITPAIATAGEQKTNSSEVRIVMKHKAVYERISEVETNPECLTD